MPNIGTVLKEEISRLSRKEIRGQVDSTKKFTAQHRRDIAALKRKVADLERRVAMLSRKALGGPVAAPKDGSAKPTRFSAKGLQSQRGRLGLSAIDFGRLLGVSSQTIYNWEQETTRPRGEQLDKLAALRKIGKREATERLQQLPPAASKPARKS
jgi:DNA-binding XRE family transcriptional regulator